jgi:hypothetical protein
MGRPGLFALFLLSSSCGPVVGFRPASALVQGASTEIGGGAVALMPRPYVDEPTQGAGQAWATHRLAPWLKLSLVTAFALAGGLAAMAVPFRYDRFVGGMELELGYAWAGASLPIATRIFKGVWLYSGPRLANLGDKLTPSAPLGLSLPLHGGFELRLEALMSWADFKGTNRRLHSGVAIVRGFGSHSR